MITDDADDERIYKQRIYGFRRQKTEMKFVFI